MSAPRAPARITKVLLARFTNRPLKKHSYICIYMLVFNNRVLAYIQKAHSFLELLAQKTVHTYIYIILRVYKKYIGIYVYVICICNMFLIYIHMYI